MAKTLKQIMATKPGKKVLVPNQDGYTPKTGDEKKFAALHKVDDNDSRSDTDNDAHFDGSNVTTYDRSANRFGYNRGQDKDAYFAPGVVPDRKVAEEEEDKEFLGTGSDYSDLVLHAVKHGQNAKAARKWAEDVIRQRKLSKERKTIKKEEEDLGEVSKALAGRYLKKASADMAKKKEAGDDDYYRRKENYDKVVDHLTKEDEVQPRALRDIVGIIVEGEVVPFKVFQKRRAEMVTKQKWDEPRGEVKKFPVKKKKVANEETRTSTDTYGYDLDHTTSPTYGDEKLKEPTVASTSARTDGSTTKDTDTPAQKRGREAVEKSKASNADRSIKRPAEREYVQMKDVPEQVEEAKKEEVKDQSNKGKLAKKLGWVKASDLVKKVHNNFKEDEQIDEISKGLAKRYSDEAGESAERFNTLKSGARTDRFRKLYTHWEKTRNAGRDLAKKKIEGTAKVNAK